MARRIILAPGAGAEPVYTFPDTGKSQGFLVLIAGLLTTDATVINRFVNLRVRDKDGNVVGDFPAEVAQLASFGMNYTWGGSNTPYSDAIPGRRQIPMNPITILGGDTLRFDTLGIQPADFWGPLLFSLLGAPEDQQES